jgi:hypothetical protein
MQCAINSPFLEEIRKLGFFYEGDCRGITKIYHSNFSKHIAVIEIDGSITLSTDISGKIPGKKSLKARRKGKFKYKWDDAYNYKPDEAAKIFAEAVK